MLKRSVPENAISSRYTPPTVATDFRLTRPGLEPEWPHDAGQLLFLLDASSALERKLLRDWVARSRPEGVDPALVARASIPRTRRRRPGDWKENPRLRARLRNGDPLLVPLRVVWLAPERNGGRSVSWIDLLKLGDPRDPDWLRQHWLLRRHPDRCAIVMGKPAPASQLREEWAAVGNTAEEANFTEFVSLRASLALERAERQLRGSRYKVPRFVHADLLSQRSVIQSLKEYATLSGRPFDEVRSVAAGYLREMAALHSPYVIDLLAHAVRALIRKAYGEQLDYDREQLRELYELGEKHTLVFLPSHKSHLDRLVLQLALYENGLPPNHTAGGINLNFFPVGPLVRRSGVFFIRRSFKDNPVYKFVLRRYVQYLIDKRFPLEWYIEGGRSRSGKLRPPRYGMLAYVVDGYRKGTADDVILIPVSIAYDQIQDVSAYAREQAGGTKTRESFAALVEFIQTLRKYHGGIHLRFGAPLSLAQAGINAEEDPDEVSVAVQKLAFEVSARINEVTPITPISLITLALLGAGDRAMTVEQTLGALEPYLNYVKQRELPTTVELRLDTPERVRSALDALTDHGIVSQFKDGPETVYAINADRHLAAAYYRNTVIHFFVNDAITELALLHAAEHDGANAAEAFWDEAMRLRDLFKFEFFFKRKKAFRRDIKAELATQDALWEQHLADGDIDALLGGFFPYTSPWVLRPFLEAYEVVAERLADLHPDESVDREPFLRDTLAVAKQYYLQRRIRSADSVSQELLAAAFELAANRGLTQAGPDVGSRRDTFRSEIRDVLRRIEGVDTLATGIHAD